MISQDVLEILGLAALALGLVAALQIFQGPPPKSPHDTPAE